MEQLLQVVHCKTNYFFAGRDNFRVSIWNKIFLVTFLLLHFNCKILIGRSMTFWISLYYRKSANPISYEHMVFMKKVLWRLWCVRYISGDSRLKYKSKKVCNEPCFEILGWVWVRVLNREHQMSLFRKAKFWNNMPILPY